MLRSWLEAQPIVVMGVVVLVIAYLFTAIVFVLIAYSPASYRRHYKQLSPVTVTALSLVLGVLLGFWHRGYGRISTALPGLSGRKPAP